jgi:hypothetical protein
MDDFECAAVGCAFDDVETTLFKFNAHRRETPWINRQSALMANRSKRFVGRCVSRTSTVIRRLDCRLAGWFTQCNTP